jgi:hypothetical protein
MSKNKIVVISTILTILISTIFCIVICGCSKSKSAEELKGQESVKSMPITKEDLAIAQKALTPYNPKSWKFKKFSYDGIFIGGEKAEKETLKQVIDFLNYLPENKAKEVKIILDSFHTFSFYVIYREE